MLNNFTTVAWPFTNTCVHRLGLDISRYKVLLCAPSIVSKALDFVHDVPLLDLHAWHIVPVSPGTCLWQCDLLAFTCSLGLSGASGLALYSSGAMARRGDILMITSRCTTIRSCC